MIVGLMSRIAEEKQLVCWMFHGAGKGSSFNMLDVANDVMKNLRSSAVFHKMIYMKET